MRMIFDGEIDLAFSPTGGFHHAGRRHAEGFCYVNDIGVAIEELLAAGRRIAYIDIDAHHGNGIQNEYDSNGDVLKISMHESGETLYPWGGFETETGAGDGAMCNVNIPLPAGTDDEFFIAAFDEIVPPLVSAYAPDIIIAVVGTDCLASDPLTHLSLTNNGMSAGGATDTRFRQAAAPARWGWVQSGKSRARVDADVGRAQRHRAAGQARRHYRRGSAGRQRNRRGKSA